MVCTIVYVHTILRDTRRQFKVGWPDAYGKACRSRMQLTYRLVRVLTNVSNSLLRLTDKSFDLKDKPSFSSWEKE